MALPAVFGFGKTNHGALGTKPKVSTSAKPSGVVVSTSSASRQQPQQQQGLWSTPAPSAAFQAAAAAASVQMPAGVRTLEEIEAELMAKSRAQQQQQPMTLEEIEKEMMKNLRIEGPTTHAPVVPQSVPAAPQQPSGYQGQFPALSGMPSFPGASQGMYNRPMESMGQPPVQHVQQVPFMDPRIAGLPISAAPPTQDTVNPDVARLLGIVPVETTGVSDDERMNAELEQKIKETELAEMKRRRKVDKIASMSRYNGIMTQGG